MAAPAPVGQLPVAWASAGKLDYQLVRYGDNFDNQGYSGPADLPPTADWSTSLVLTYLKGYMPWEYIYPFVGVAGGKNLNKTIEFLSRQQSSSCSAISLTQQLGSLASAADMLSELGPLLESQIPILAFAAALLLLAALYSSVVCISRCVECRRQGSSLGLRQEQVMKQSEQWKAFNAAVLVLLVVLVLVAAQATLLGSMVPAAQTSVLQLADIARYGVVDAMAWTTNLMLDVKYCVDVLLGPALQNIVWQYERAYIQTVSNNVTFDIAGIITSQLDNISFDVQRAAETIDRAVAASAYVLHAGSAAALIYTNVVANLTAATVTCRSLSLQSTFTCNGIFNNAIEFPNFTVPAIRTTLDATRQRLAALNWAGLRDEVTNISNTINSAVAAAGLRHSTQGWKDSAISEVQQKVKDYNLTQAIYWSRDAFRGIQMAAKNISAAYETYAKEIPHILYAMFGVVVFFCLGLMVVVVIGELSLRDSKFPHMQRSCTTDCAGQVMHRCPMITLVWIVPVLLLAAASYIASVYVTLATDSFNTMEVFDLIIDKSMLLPRRIRLPGKIINLTSYKSMFLSCRNDVGILEALQQRSALNDILPLIPGAGNTTSGLERSARDAMKRAIIFPKSSVLLDLTAIDTPDFAAGVRKSSNITKTALVTGWIITSYGNETTSGMIELLTNWSAEAEAASLATAGLPASNALKDIAASYRDSSLAFALITDHLQNASRDLDVVDGLLLSLNQTLSSAKIAAADVQLKLDAFQSRLRQNQSDAEFSLALETLINATVLPISNHLQELIITNVGKCGIVSVFYNLLLRSLYDFTTKCLDSIWFCLVAFGLAMIGASVASYAMSKYYRGVIDLSGHTTPNEKFAAVKKPLRKAHGPYLTPPGSLSPSPQLSLQTLDERIAGDQLAALAVAEGLDQRGNDRRTPADEVASAAILLSRQTVDKETQTALHEQPPRAVTPAPGEPEVPAAPPAFGPTATAAAAASAASVVSAATDMGWRVDECIASDGGGGRRAGTDIDCGGGARPDVVASPGPHGLASDLAACRAREPTLTTSAAAVQIAACEQAAAPRRCASTGGSRRSTAALSASIPASSETILPLSLDDIIVRERPHSAASTREAGQSRRSAGPLAVPTQAPELGAEPAGVGKITAWRIIVTGGKRSSPSDMWSSRKSVGGVPGRGGGGSRAAAAATAGNADMKTRGASSDIGCAQQPGTQGAASVYAPGASEPEDGSASSTASPIHYHDRRASSHRSSAAAARPRPGRSGDDGPTLARSERAEEREDCQEDAVSLRSIRSLMQAADGPRASSLPPSRSTRSLSPRALPLMETNSKRRTKPPSTTTTAARRLTKNRGTFNGITEEARDDEADGPADVGSSPDGAAAEPRLTARWYASLMKHMGGDVRATPRPAT